MDPTALVLALAPAMPYLAFPFLASTAAALVCAVVHLACKRQPGSGIQAGPWLTERVGTMPVDVGIAPEVAGSMDGYWPDSRFIGLSPRTWVDETPAGRAVAAHELGHALAWAERPERSRRLATARQAQQHLLALGGAAWFTAALTHNGFAAAVGVIALVLSIPAEIAVLVDEADASRRAAHLLEQHGERSAWTDLAMTSAWAVYLAPALMKAGLLAASPWLMPRLLDGGSPLSSNGALGLWSILLLAPILLLRGAQVVMESLRPARVTTEFRLNWTLFQERSWEFQSGVIVLLWMALTLDQPVAEGLAPLFLLGAIPAMGPLGALGKMAVVLPIYFTLAAFGVFKEPSPATRTTPTPSPRDPLDVIQTDAPWSRRATGLIRVAWLPLLLVLVTRAVSGW